ncbi:MAG: cation diffusion facilitator family transporter [Actinobacteria bacterium]|nr:cation diffusion facilitator family transporter [Actinomycetota bacterium]
MTSVVKTKTNTAILSVLSNSLLIVLKVVVGLLIGSVSVISEAIHSGVDLIAALIALFAVRASGRAADERHPYGHGKFENVSGTVEAILILLAAVWIIYAALRKIISPQLIDMPAWGVGVMLVSAMVNTLVSRRLFKVGKQTDSVALQADAWHLRTDVYTSVGVMAGLLVIWIVNLAAPSVDIRWLDPAIAIIVALMILKAAWDLTRESARDLLDVSLPEEDVSWIQSYVTQTWPQVRSFHNLRTRKAGSNRFIDFHVAVSDTMSVGEAHALGDEIVVAIKERLPESRIQIHIEPCDRECKQSCVNGCSVEREG